MPSASILLETVVLHLNRTFHPCFGPCLYLGVFIRYPGGGGVRKYEGDPKKNRTQKGGIKKSAGIRGDQKIFMDIFDIKAFEIPYRIPIK